MPSLFSPMMFRGPFFGGHHCGGSTRGFWPAFGITAGITAGLGLFSALFGHKSSTTYSGYYPGTSMMGYSGMSMMGWPGMSMGYPGLNLSKNAEDPLSGLKGLYSEYNFEMIEGKYCARLKDGSGDVITASSQQELMSKLGTPKTQVSDKAKAQVDDVAKIRDASQAETPADDDAETSVPPSSSRSTGSSSRTRSTGSSNDGQTTLYKSGRYTKTINGQTYYYAADCTRIKKEYFEIKEGLDIDNQVRKDYSAGRYSITKNGIIFYFEANGNVTDDPAKFEEAVGIRKTCKSGRYTRTINGQTYYYAADGTRIKKEYFEIKERQNRPNTPMSPMSAELTLN